MAALELKGGERLQKKLADIARKLGARRAVRAGFLENATYPDGTSVAQVAAMQNFGTSTAPPRAFFTNVIKQKSPEWAVILMQLLKNTDYDVDRAMNQMGAVMAGQIRQAIVDMNDPALSPITLMLRKIKDERGDPNGTTITAATLGEAAQRVAAGEQGVSGTRAKVLVDTAHMLNSVDHEVVGG